MGLGRAIVFLVPALSVSALLPYYGDVSNFDSEPINFPLFETENLKKRTKDKRTSLNEDAPHVLDNLNNIILDKDKFCHRKSGVSAQSMKELEDLVTHPTWKKKNNFDEINRRVFVSPASHENQWYPKPYADEPNKQHIQELITKFETYRPKPITDNRLSKFVFTNDADLANSKTVQEHNKEVAAAFMDFNKKLEETLSVKAKKISTNDKPDSKDGVTSFDRFLENKIRKLREEMPHRQVCRKHKMHYKEADEDLRESKVPPLKQFVGFKRFNDLIQTRDGLENILIGLDRPRSGPFRRHVTQNHFPHRISPHKKFKILHNTS